MADPLTERVQKGDLSWPASQAACRQLKQSTIPYPFNFDPPEGDSSKHRYSENQSTDLIAT